MHAAHMCQLIDFILGKWRSFVRRTCLYACVCLTWAPVWGRVRVCVSSLYSKDWLMGMWFLIILIRVAITRKTALLKWNTSLPRAIGNAHSHTHTHTLPTFHCLWFCSVSLIQSSTYNPSSKHGEPGTWMQFGTIRGEYVCLMNIEETFL